jgi:hypothetical protein
VEAGHVQLLRLSGRPPLGGGGGDGSGGLRRQVLDEELGDLLAPLALGQVERTPALDLAHRVGLGIEQRTHQHGFALMACHPQRRHASIIHLVHLRPRREQHENDVSAAAVLARLVERRRAIITRRISGRARVEQ